MGALQAASNLNVDALSFDMKLSEVTHAIRFFQESCDNHYPYIKEQQFYFDSHFELSKKNCFSFIGNIFGSITQGVLIAETISNKAKFDLFIDQTEFFNKGYLISYLEYSQKRQKAITFLSSPKAQPILPDVLIDDICTKEMGDVIESRIDLHLLKKPELLELLNAVSQFCRLVNQLNNIQFVFISTVALTVNRGFAILVSEFAKLKEDDLQNTDIPFSALSEIHQYAKSLLVFYNRIFSVFLLDEANTTVIHTYMKNFRSIG
ncbi:TPA: hypothetical protein ACGIK9_002926 [Acinetobacter baumannii]|uniref:hypothetical protein n=1 Tax=Acinetobacter baumannii TaxID=470 RepID=UPI00338ED2AF